MKSKIRKQEELVNKLLQRLGSCYLSDFRAIQKELLEQRRILQAMKSQG